MRTVALLCLLLMPSFALAEDLCVQFLCKGEPRGHGYPFDKVKETRVPALNVNDAVAYLNSSPDWSREWAGRKITCSCSGALHVPSASEVAGAMSSDVKQAIVQSMQDAVKAALIDIQKENAQREARIYERMAELQKANEAQIRLLTELLKMSMDAPPAAAQVQAQDQTTPPKEPSKP